MSRQNFIGFDFGVIFAFSIPTSTAGGTKIVRTRKILDNAVYITAFFAQFCDFPYGSSVSLSRTSIPFSISVYLMK